VLAVLVSATSPIQSMKAKVLLQKQAQLTNTNVQEKVANNGVMLLESAGLGHLAGKSWEEWAAAGVSFDEVMEKVRVNGADFCWKDSYGRGVGLVPSVCGSGKQQIGALCYDQCPSGYESSGFGCRKLCPAGWSTYVLTCSKWGWPWEWQTISRDGWERAPVTMNCRSDQQYDAGLCYPPCAAFHTGVGPVCWGYCPTNYVNCGAACASDNAACAKQVTDQVKSVFEAGFNIAELIATGGVSSVKDYLQGIAENVGAGAVEWGPKLVLLATKLGGRTEDIAVVCAALGATKEHGGADLNMADIVNMLGALDPTGLVSMVSTFIAPTCAHMDAKWWTLGM